MSRRPMPPVIRIEPASACNLRCSHCPTGVLAPGGTIMKPSVFARVMSELKKHVPPIRVAVLYHGGEPFLNKHLLDYVREIKALGIPFAKTVTNGMLIRSDMTSPILMSGLDAIEFSLDGESAEENDRVRARCDFEHVRDVVIRLAAAKRAAGHAIRIFVASTQFRAADDRDFNRSAEVPRFLETAFSSVLDCIEFKVTWAVQWPSGRPDKGYDLLRDERPSPSSCSLLDETLSIRADGRVVACCYDLTSESNLGNIMEQSLAEIWQGEAYERFRADFSAGNYPAPCAGCAVVTGPRYLVRPAL
jgi:radical SAM protein with 4Fe4S-binding SPASM domain